MHLQPALVRFDWRRRMHDSGWRCPRGPKSAAPVKRRPHVLCDEASKAHSVAQAVIEGAESAQWRAECLSTRKGVMRQAGKGIKALGLPS